MKRFSEQLIHIGISFLTLPGISITNLTSLKFQQALNENGLDFNKFEKSPDNKVISIFRESPSPLQIIVDTRQTPPAQLTIIAPNPKTTKELFCDEVDAVISAYDKTWPAEKRQVIHTDGVVRELLEASGDVIHAFQELWELRLKQPIDSLKIFGQPVRGGGLRFVLDPIPNNPDPVQIEVKIESYLQDTKKIFVETIFNWFSQGTIDPRKRITYMDDYLKERVYKFILGETEDVQ
jgi:hypothetical protein